ncbi:MAG: hypothetical protein AAGC60_20025 [Acidobacteriota bacterium]
MPKPPENQALAAASIDHQLADVVRRARGARDDLAHVIGAQQDAYSQEVTKELAAALKVDVGALAEKAATTHRERREAAEKAVHALRAEARDLVKRRAVAFDEQLRELRRSGFAQAIEASCHNPRLLMKLCFDWDAEGSPPPGMNGTSNIVDWDFDTIDDPMLGAFIDRVHAHAGADAGDRHYETSHGDVDLTLRFRHPPRAEQTVAEEVMIDLSAFGFIESDISTDMFASQTRALSAGGFAGFTVSATISQDYTWPSGLRGSHSLDLGAVNLATCSSLGAIWVLGWIPIPLGGVPYWQPIDVRRRLSFPAVFPIYGRSNPRQPYGDDVQVDVRFHLETNARGEGADASIDFRADEGLSMRVLEVIVETAD